jgi:hypothetical protein
MLCQCFEPTDPSKRMAAWIRYLSQIAKYRNNEGSKFHSGTFWDDYPAWVPKNAKDGTNFFDRHTPKMVAVTVFDPPSDASGGSKDTSVPKSPIEAMNSVF